MKQNRTDRSWHPAAQCALGIIVVALLTFVAFRFQAGAATAVLLYLVVIVLMSLWAPFVPAAIVATVAVFCLQYFFVSPVISFGADMLDVVALASFLTTALVITRLMSTVRKSFEEIQRSERTLRERANLLDLTHDTVFVRDMNEVITYWNRGAEEMYGWSRQEALGKTTHELLHTIFPAPLEEITAVLLRTDRWEGELVHTRRDGARRDRGEPVVCAARRPRPADRHARNQQRHHRAEAGRRGRAQGAGRAGSCRTRHDPGRDGRVDRARGRPAALGRRHQRERLPALPDRCLAESRRSARRPAGHRPRRPARERRDRADSNSCPQNDDREGAAGHQRGHSRGRRAGRGRSAEDARDGCAPSSPGISRACSATGFSCSRWCSTCC